MSRGRPEPTHATQQVGVLAAARPDGLPREAAKHAVKGNFGKG